jgi:hypothetical protein
MTGLFLALQGQRRLQNRIGDGLGEGCDDRAGAAFGVEDLLPEGHLPEAVQRGVVQDGPGQCLWIVVDIGLRKVRAESIAML